MNRLKRSLLSQYLLIILIAMMILPATLMLLSTLFFHTLYKTEKEDRFYNGTDIEAMWHKTAKELSSASEDDIEGRFTKLKSIYKDASLFWIDDSGAKRVSVPDTLSIRQNWSISDAIQFMKKSRGDTADPFTVVAFLGEKQNAGFIVFQIPRSAMESPSDLLREKYDFLFIVALLVVFSVFIIISALFFFRIRKRLLHLQKAMEIPENTGIPIMISVKQNDEIGQLEKSFNLMIVELEAGKQQQWEEEKLRKELIANLSHDLRTPLTTIRGHAYRLQKEPLSEKGKESAALLDEKISYMGDLIDNLVSYTLLSTGKYPYHPEQIDINRVVRKSIADWYPTFENMNFKIEIAIPDEQLIWNIDPQWFRRILDNLLQNIYRHAQSGKFVAIRVLDDMLIIEDHGPGMNAESTEQGVGIGLSVVSLMIKEMKLTWDIHTDENGTRIEIRNQ